MLKRLILLVGLLAGAAGAQELSFGLHSGRAKQEMEGAGPHFSLTGPVAGLTLDASRAVSDRLTLGLRYSFDAAPPASALRSGIPWQAATGRRAEVLTHSLTVTGRIDLWSDGDLRLQGSLGLGLASSRVRIAARGAYGSDSSILPRAEVGLRLRREDLFAEVLYFASPRQRVTLSGGSGIAHETSGLRFGFGFVLD